MLFALFPASLDRGLVAVVCSAGIIDVGVILTTLFLVVLFASLGRDPDPVPSVIAAVVGILDAESALARCALALRYASSVRSGHGRASAGYRAVRTLD